MSIVIFDAGAFIQLERRDRIALAFTRRLRESATIVVAATTLAEVWHGKPAGLHAVSLVRPHVVAVGEALAKRAGELLAIAGRKDTLDAFVIAVAEQESATEIYTSDVADVRALLDASAIPRCAAVPV